MADPPPRTLRPTPQPRAAVIAAAELLHTADDRPRHPLHRRRRSVLALLLAITAMAGSALLLGGANSGPYARIDAVRRAHVGNGRTTDDDASDVVEYRKKNCQIIYVLGVEGSIHHGIVPVIKALAERQVDPVTGEGYDVVKGHELLRSAIFDSSCARRGGDGGGGDDGDGEEEEEGPCVGGEGGKLSMDDPSSVQTLLREMCPYYTGTDRTKRHVIIEGNSFPSGRSNENYRVTRQSDWSSMTPEEISTSETALNHPTSLYDFYDSFGPYVDVRFVVLHRPYMEIIASHPNFDGGPRRHSVVISGFIILLSRFLAGHMYSISLGGNVPLWTILCTDRLSSRSFLTEGELHESRASVLRYVANFLGWPDSACPECFDDWVESEKRSSPRESFGDKAADEILGNARMLESIWPPRRPEDALPQQQCGLL